MSDITKAQFKASFKYGVDLNHPEVAKALAGSDITRSDLDKLDKNNDGLLKGAELDAAFKYVDGFDKNGSKNSFKYIGKSQVAYDALLKGKKDAPNYGDDIAKSAADRVAADGANYAFDKAPTSPHPNLSGNATPGTSRPAWLKDQNKCNQFVGDALTQAGVKMPTYEMANGSEHYVEAESLPKYSSHFDRVTDVKDLKKGDVVVIDYPGAGASTAHTEVVTGTGPLKTTGAHHDGAYETDRSNLLKDATYQANDRSWLTPDGNKIYLLHPIKKD